MTCLSRKYWHRSNTAWTTEMPQNAPMKVQNQTRMVGTRRGKSARYPSPQLNHRGSLCNHGRGRKGFRYSSISKSSFMTGDTKGAAGPQCILKSVDDPGHCHGVAAELSWYAGLKMLLRMFVGWQGWRVQYPHWWNFSESLLRTTPPFRHPPPTTIVAAAASDSFVLLVLYTRFIPLDLNLIQWRN